MLFTEYFKYIDLVIYKSKADLRMEARRYYLSYVWWVLEPFFEMMIFFLIFGILLGRGGPDFIEFLLIGLITWKWFATTVNHCGRSIISGKNLIQQVVLPKLFFPTVIIITDTFKACIVMIVIGIFLNISGHYPSCAYLSLPIIMLTQLLFIISIGYILAAIIPFFPDLTIVVSLLLRAGFYLSGVFYNTKKIPEKYKDIFFLNPIARLIDNYRNVLINHKLPDFYALFIICTVSLLLIFLTVSIISRHETEYPRLV